MPYNSINPEIPRNLIAPLTKIKDPPSQTFINLNSHHHITLTAFHHQLTLKSFLVNQFTHFKSSVHNPFSYLISPSPPPFHNFLERLYQIYLFFSSFSSYLSSSFLLKLKKIRYQRTKGAKSNPRYNSHLKHIQTD